MTFTPTKSDPIAAVSGANPATAMVRSVLQAKRVVLSVGILLAIAQSSFMLPIPMVVRRAFDHAIPGRDHGELFVLAAALVALSTLSGFVAVVSLRLVQRATKTATQSVRQAIIDQIFRADLPKIDGLDPEDVHERLIGDPVRVESAANAVFCQVLPAIILFGGLLGLLVSIDPFLTLVVAASAPILFIFDKAIRPSLRRSMLDTQRAFEDLGKQSLMLVRAQLLLRGRGIDGEAQAQAYDQVASLRDQSQGRSFRLAARGALQSSGLSLASAATLVVGGNAVISGRLSLGSLLSFFAAVALIRAPSGTLTSIGPVLLEGRLSLARLNGHLSLPLGSRPSDEGDQTIRRVDEIALSNVSYAYDGRNVVHNLSLIVRPGRVLALSGPNGSGKTTVLTLLLGLVRPKDGKVTANGLDLVGLDGAQFRRQIGVLFQHAHFLPGTLRENLVRGRKDVTDADLQRALHDAEASSIVARLPSGLDCLVGEDFDRLSGGERQRLSLARALLGRPGTIILDEPSNHVPTAVIIRVVERLRRWPEPPAVLIISHDPSLSAIADDRETLRRPEPEEHVA